MSTRQKRYTCNKYCSYIPCVIVTFLLPYSTYILQVFNFANFTNLESFMKLIQLKFEPHASAKIFQQIPFKTAICENL